MHTVSNRSAWQIQKAVVNALLLRELKTRFGSYKLGYAWVLLEPLSHVLILAIMLGYIVGRTMPGVSYPLFLVAGIMPYLLFQSIINRGSQAIRANRPLFNYRQLKPFDAFLTRVALEVIIHAFAFSAILILAWCVGVEFSLVKPLHLIAAQCLLLLIAAGIAMPLCFLDTKFEEFKKFLPIILRPLYFLSGIFYSLDMIPTQYHKYLLWNPVIHTNEITRAALFEHYSDQYVSLEYLALLAVVSVALGMSVFRLTSRDMVTS